MSREGLKMANNRMYFVHRPSGVGVYLGKRMAVGWYDVPNMERHQRIPLGHLVEGLFSYVEENSNPPQQDDFIIVMEDASGAPGAFEADVSPMPGDDTKRLFTNIRAAQR